MKKIRSYSELQQLRTFEERYEYLKIPGDIGVQTFGFDRYLNQLFYQSLEWRSVRDEVIVRDNGCDLGIEDLVIYGGARVHHMNPITVEDLREGNPDIFNSEFLISSSSRTHRAIHYGKEDLKPVLPIERRPNDTSPWKKEGGIYVKR